jgi:hypothetical protein
MTGPGKKMHVSVEMLFELLQENEYCDVSENKYTSDSEIEVKILSSGEQSVISDEKEIVSDNSSMQNGMWADTGAEQPHLLFTELFYVPEIAEIIAEESNWYAQKFLESTPGLKPRYRSHYWNEMNRIEIMKSLAFFLLQVLHQRPHNIFSHRKILETPIFLDICSERKFHLLKFFHFVDNKSYDEATCNSKRLYIVLSFISLLYL